MNSAVEWLLLVVVVSIKWAAVIFEFISSLKIINLNIIIIKMSGDNIDEQFAQFLRDNKIDVSALEGTKDKDRLLNPKEQRNISILRAVITIVFMIF